MQKLNKLLGTKHNFSRINLLDLQRLVKAIQRKKDEPIKVFNAKKFWDDTTLKRLRMRHNARQKPLP